MQVFLTRDLRGDDEHQQVRLALPSMTAVGYQTGRREASLYIYVEACTRNEAETIARKAVEAVLGPDEIERVGGADDTMQNRQMMLWIRGTLRQVRRWEIALAVNIRAQLANQSPEPHEIWDAQIERHLALVAANNLLRAIDNADGRFTTMPGDMARDIRNQRDLQEHWDEQWPAFYNSTKPGPLKRGGTVFAASYPGSSPYSFPRLEQRHRPEARARPARRRPLHIPRSGRKRGSGRRTRPCAIRQRG